MFKREDFGKIVDRRIDVITTEALFRAWTDKALYKSLIREDLYAGRSFVLLSEYFVSLEDITRVKKLAFSEGLAKFGALFCATGEKCGEEALSYSDAVNRRDFSTSSVGELFKTLSEFDEKALKIIAFTWPTHPIALVIENQLREVVSKREGNAAKCDDLIATLTFPTRENTPVTENRELMKISLEISKLNSPPSSLSQLPPKLQAKIEQHVEKFGFLGARGYGLKRWTIEDVFRRAVETASDPALSEKIQKSQNESKHNLQETQKIMAELKFSPEERQLVGAAKEIVYFRTYRTEAMYHIYSDIDNLLAEVGRRCGGYSIQQMRSMTTGEILSLEKARVDPVAIAEREKFFAITCDHGKIEVLEGKSLEKVKHLMVEQKTDVTELKGTIACRGKATGVAKIVLTSVDLGKVKQGDVLVTIMTTPDFVPAMQRAAAFITNEGGITCHAAIVARELNKPCIIGTKTATKTFKDGDLVEVDADKGTVKILKRL